MATTRQASSPKPPLLRLAPELLLLILGEVAKVSKHDLISVSSCHEDLRDTAQELVFDEVKLLTRDGTERHATQTQDYAKIAEGRPDVTDSRVHRVFSSWPQSFLRFTKSLAIHDFYLIESAPIPAWLHEGIGRMLLKPKQLESLELDFHHSIVEAGPSPTLSFTKNLWTFSLDAYADYRPWSSSSRSARGLRGYGPALHPGNERQGARSQSPEYAGALSLLPRGRGSKQPHPWAVGVGKSINRLAFVPDRTLTVPESTVREAMEVDAFSFYPPMLTPETRPYFEAKQVQMFAKGLSEEMTPNGVEYWTGMRYFIPKIGLKVNGRLPVPLVENEKLCYARGFDEPLEKQ
ncbi:hypothetical protein HDK90DRAFT_470971 [Phyllosticta capitalensis]|uniref:F-box domain-containing protein n=1 Tax=Phyllosticta capitalensis TaxID=121624 RepID=A0ABR1Y9A0_9PEZI